jgi:SAM-dependent methyltransferase
MTEPRDKAYEEYREERIRHWDQLAAGAGTGANLGEYYHGRLLTVYQGLIPPHQSILELGCGRGDLLAGLRPRRGVGLDFSPRVLAEAGARHPELEFFLGDALEAQFEEKFDFIILSDLANEIWDVQALLERARLWAGPRTRLIINTYSRVWEYPLLVAEKLGLRRPSLSQNWLTVEDLANLMRLTGFEVVRSWPEMLWPGPPRFWADLVNRYLARVAPFKWFNLTNFMVARPVPAGASLEPPPRVSVIVPARNEAGNIRAIFERTPELGGGTELVLVEGHSTDGTFETMASVREDFPERDCLLLRQTGRGKGEAVRLGMTRASGQIFMILDADLTVPPEDLPRFYRALVEGQGDFINGVRLVYPMEKEAMRFANLFGNKFFSLLFTWLLGQPIKDTLCGTKVLWREDYELLAANRDYFGDFDPFGDFDLLFGAVKLNLKIVEIPIRYRQRTYGSTNIDRWRHGWLLLKMAAFASGKIKFI